MKYTLPGKRNSCIPELYFYLCSVDVGYLHNKEHGLMHPADVFTTVFDEVVASGDRLVTALLEMKDNTEKRQDQHVNSLISGFLYSLSNFIDGCKSIVKCFFSKEDEKKYKKIISTFVNQCETYIDYVNTKVNYIKHRHRSIATGMWEWQKGFILGYYINGPIDDNMNGPDPDIHKDVNCAISMNWELPYHMVNLYWLSASLQSFLINIRRPTVNSDIKVGDHEIKKLLTDVSQLNRFLLPDEFSKDQAMVIKKGIEFTLEYPAKVKAENTDPHNMQLSMTSKIGYGARSFVIPYANRTAEYLMNQLASKSSKISR